MPWIAICHECSGSFERNELCEYCTLVRDQHGNYLNTCWNSRCVAMLFTITAPDNSSVDEWIDKARKI